MNYDKLNYEQIKSLIFYFESLNKEDIELFKFNNQNDLLLFISKAQGFHSWFAYKTYLLKKQTDKYHKIVFQHNAKSNALWGETYNQFTYQKINFSLDQNTLKFNYFSNNDKITTFEFAHTKNSITKTKQPILFKSIDTHIYTDNQNIINALKNKLPENINYIHISKDKNNTKIDFLKEIFDSTYFDDIFLDDVNNVNQFNFIWTHIIKHFYSSYNININTLLNSLSINFLINAYLNIEKKEHFLSNLLLKYLKKLPELKINDLTNISWTQSTIDEHKKNCENLFLKLFEIKNLYEKHIFYNIEDYKNSLNISHNQVNLYIPDNISLFGVICVEEWIDLVIKNNNNPIVFINENIYDFSSKYIDKNIIHILINPNKDNITHPPSQIIFGTLHKPFDFSIVVKDIYFSTLKSIETNPFYMNNSLLQDAENTDCFIWQPQHLSLNDFNNFDYQFLSGKLT